MGDKEERKESEEGEKVVVGGFGRRECHFLWRIKAVVVDWWVTG